MINGSNANSEKMDKELLEVVTSFENMQRVGEVDPTILGSIKDINNRILKKQKKILKLKIDNVLKFILFHSGNLQNNFLMQLTDRLKKAKAENDNPKVADDALEVLPLFIQIFENTDNLIIKQDEEGLDELDESSSLFQSMLMERSLFPPSEIILKNVNKQILKKEVQRIHQTLGEQLHGY